MRLAKDWGETGGATTRQPQDAWIWPELAACSLLDAHRVTTYASFDDCVNCAANGQTQRCIDTANFEIKVPQPRVK